MSSLSPREIQSRIRGGATVQEVADEAGVDPQRIEGFALPVLAEREHMASNARRASVRRRGNGAGHRRLGEIIADRLEARGLDPEAVEWDAWRQLDRRWRVTATLAEPAPREAEFIFDPRGRFCVADNADARWMIGEQLPGSPDTENTVDLDDEFAIVRAVQEPSQPGDEVPDSSYQNTPELDEFYDMLSGISEDSVRIYIGFEDEAEADESGEEPPPPAAEAEEPAPIPDEADEPTVQVNIGRVEVTQHNVTIAPEPEAANPTPEVVGSQADPVTEPEQGALIGDEPQPPAKKPRRRRASVPSWDEIMLGGPGPSGS